MLTENEKDLIEKLGECWNDFLRLDTLHPDDNNEFRFNIHALQNIILSRSGYREIKQIEAA